MLLTLMPLYHFLILRHFLIRLDAFRFLRH